MRLPAGDRSRLVRNLIKTEKTMPDPQIRPSLWELDAGRQIANIFNVKQWIPPLGEPVLVYAGQQWKIATRDSGHGERSAFFGWVLSRNPDGVPHYAMGVRFWTYLPPLLDDKIEPE